MDKHNKHITAAARGVNSVPQRRRGALWIVLAIMLAALIAALSFLLLAPHQAIYKVTNTDLVQTVVASGRVQTPLRVEIGSQIIGIVSSIPVAEGQRVRRGQLLIALDDTEARAAVEQAKAVVGQAEARLTQLREVALPAAGQAVRQAEVTLQNARRQYERSLSLYERGFIGQAQLDDHRRSMMLADSQWRSARLQVQSNAAGGSDTRAATSALEQAKAGLRMALARLNYSTIEAPADGILIGRDVESGDVVQPGKTLMVLSPAGKTQLVVQMDERNLAALSVGQQALASADAYPEQRFATTLAYISPAVDPQRGSVEVKFDVPAAPAYLRQDMTVSVDIEVARHPHALVIPSDAVQGDAADSWVFKISDGVARRQSVKLGLRSAGKVEIRSGLEAGDAVVARPAGIREGQRIRAATAPAAAATEGRR